jgi:putative ABC transport system permease protein
VAEVTLAVVLLVGAGLLVRSFAELRRAPLGYDPAGVLTVGVSLPQHRYPDPPRWRAFHRQLLERVSGLPGVASAATVTLRPLWGTVGMDWLYTLEGQTSKEAERNPLLNFETVSPDYFRTLGLPVIRGRAFTSADAEGQPGVVVVSESVARRAWPGQDPIGKRLKIPLPGTPYHDTWLSVVGVAKDARYREIQASRLDLYMSLLQSNHGPNHLLVRASGDPTSLVPAIRAVVWELDPDQPVTEATTLTDVVSTALGGPRFAARVFGGFAVAALLLSALGLYGLLSYTVSRRTREIGVRVAVGARPRDVRGLVLREGLGLCALGVVLGLLVAAATSRLLEALLYEVRPSDPLTFVAVPPLLLGVAALACLLPARRAMRVDPVVALRTE